MFQPTHYLGIDPDAKRIDYARKLYPNHTFQVLLQDKPLPLDDNTVDYVLIIAVLHHISSNEIAAYMREFQRILKPTGTIIVMEPCLCKKKPLCNYFMNWYDKGEYIRDEEGYLQLFRDSGNKCNVIKRFRKCFLYHELFFSAKPELLPMQEVISMTPTTQPINQQLVPFVQQLENEEPQYNEV
ncbi:MAG: ubiE8 [Paenibacillus sp.]|nr:ubiE8 [Paenibacillus sp.]